MLHYMKLIDATPAKPIYSVLYQYVGGGTLYSFTHYFEVTGDKKKPTMEATDDFGLAKRCADYLLTQPMVQYATVNKHTGGLGYEPSYTATK